MDDKAPHHKETIMCKDNIFLKKDELYKLTFPVSLLNHEHFTIVLQRECKEKEKVHITEYENTLNSILIKSNDDVKLSSIEVWTHQKNDSIII